MGIAPLPWPLSRRLAKNTRTGAFSPLCESLVFDSSTKKAPQGGHFVLERVMGIEPT